MVIKLVSLIIVLFSVFVRSQDLTEAQITKRCESSTITTCDECINAHPECAWCANAKSNSNIKRCRKYSKLLQLQECSIQYPRSSSDPAQNLDLSQPGRNESEVVQLQPQQINIDIRKGDTVKFNVTFRKVTDYPVDLYYLMDLSYSMRDDLNKLKELGRRLTYDIQNNVTQNIQMGFGTFVDKVMMPFASTVPEQLQNPCSKNQDSSAATCAPPFGFKHQQSISKNLENFRYSVNNTVISGNIDSPEGSLDALMQIAVCGDMIGWRNESTHLVVVTTDASFHMALDGKLAAILEANDMKCHLSQGANSHLPDDVVYDKSQELDYPSIGQFRSACKKYKIQPIFAVTKDVQPLYEGLTKLIPNSFVDELAADSNNIITIIKTAYNKLKGKLDMSLGDNIPPEVQLNYRVLCPDAMDWMDNSLSCDQIQIGSEVVYEFEVNAIECPTQNITQPLTFTSSSLQEDVKIYFNFLCSCPCSKSVEPQSPSCNYNGSLVCGICECDSNHEGASCQCTRDQEDVSLLESCKKPGSNGDICEGNGQCQCGQCHCNEGYKNQYCECSDKGCPTINNMVCGGPDQGTCENCLGDALCNCTNGWTLDPNIQTCTCHTKLCKANSTDSLLCSGHGSCDCNRCECFNQSTIYSGKYCDICISPECKEAISCEKTMMTECAQCVNEAQRLRKNENEQCLEQCSGINYRLISSIPDCKTCLRDQCHPICNEIDVSILPPKQCSSVPSNSDCNLFYDIVWKKSINDYLLLVKEFNNKEDCPQAINPLLIVLPIVGGIVLLGLICLVLWKIYQTMRDKREWMNFENEMKKSKWTKGQNPIFEKPFTRFENPTFHAN